MKKPKWEVAGHVPVDSGCIMLSDPCYAVQNIIGQRVGNDRWLKFCDKLWDLEKKNRVAGASLDLGYVATGFGGDGFYPVEIRKDDRGMVKELRIRF
jgi:hypothetical protein